MTEALTITKVDVYVILAVFYCSISVTVWVLIARDKIPSVDTLAELAALFNTKGGIIMFLWMAWLGTLTSTLGFGVWVIVKGVNPQHMVVTVLLGMLISQAFGNVNGALFKTMTGEEPSRNGNGNGKTPVPQPAPAAATEAAPH